MSLAGARVTTSWTGAGPLDLAAAQVPTLLARVPSDEVRLQVLVTRRGRPIEGLSADDFEVRDAGKVRHATLVTEPLPTRAVVVLDTSGSVVRRKDDLREAVQAFVEALRADDTTAFITFSERVFLDVPPTRGRPGVDRVLRTVDGMQPTGRTALREALFSGLMLADAEGVRPLLLVFTDGTDNVSWLQPPAVLDAAGRSDVVVQVLLANRLDLPATQETPPGLVFLRRLRDMTGGMISEAPADSLRNQFVRILDEFRARYVLAFTPDPSDSDGQWHDLKVTVKNGTGDVRARSGYFAKRFRS